MAVPVQPWRGRGAEMARRLRSSAICFGNQPAAYLLRAAAHPKIVSERLGHSTIMITLDTYSHVLPGMQEDAPDRIDLALRNALGRKSFSQM